jgi:hypothetical protein
MANRLSTGGVVVLVLFFLCVLFPPLSLYLLYAGAAGAIIVVVPALQHPLLIGMPVTAFTALMLIIALSDRRRARQQFQRPVRVKPARQVSALEKVAGTILVLLCGPALFGLAVLACNLR